MDYGLITGTLSALATLRDLGQTALGIRDAAEMGTVVVRMNEQVLNVQNNLYRHQAELMALQQQFHEAQQKIRDLEARESERDRYELHEPYRGTFVYRLKDDVGQEPPHMLCQTCFDKGSKSVLQVSTEYAHCRLCKNAYQMRNNRY